MGTIRTTLRVDADARSAARGLRPLGTALDEARESAQDAEKSLRELGDRHRIRVDDTQLERARDEVGRLRREMRNRLEVDVNADTRDLQRKIGGLRRTIRELERDDVHLDVKVDTTDLIAARGMLRGNLDDVRAGAARVGGIVTTIAAGVGIATLGVGTLVGKLALESLSLADQMARARIAFTQFLGTRPKADRFLKRLEDFAARTPFEFSELVDSSQRLLAFGVDAEDVVGIMESLGDAAALTGNNVDELAVVWGQMEAKGRVANEELLQLTERGVPAYQMLADAMGLTVPEVQKLASEGKLLSSEVLPTLQARMDETFGGGMQQQARTLGGLWSTVQDAAAGIGRELGDAFTPVVAEQLDNMIGKLEEWGAWAAENKEVVVGVFADMTGAALNFAADFVDAFSGMTGALATYLDVLGDAQGVLKWMVPASRLTDFDDIDLNESADRLKSLTGELDDVAAGLRSAGDEAVATGEKFGESFSYSDNLTRAQNKVSDLRTELGELRKSPPTVEVEARTDEVEAALAWWETRRRQLEAEKTAATLDLKIEGAEGKLAEINSALDNLRGKKSTPEVRADINHWETQKGKVEGQLEELRKKRAEVKVAPTTDKTAEGKVKGDLDDLAKRRQTGILPQVDQLTRGIADSVLDELAKTRTARIEVEVRRTTPFSAGPLLEPSGGQRAQGMSLMSLAEASTSLAAPRAFSTGPGGGRAVAGPPPAPIALTAAAAGLERRRVTPKRTPVAVYLDGAEIADRVASRVASRALAASSSRRA